MLQAGLREQGRELARGQSVRGPVLAAAPGRCRPGRGHEAARALQRGLTARRLSRRVASAYARLAATELATGRKPRVHDTWIAATALVHGAEVWTQHDDFSGFSAVDVVRV